MGPENDLQLGFMSTDKMARRLMHLSVSPAQPIGFKPTLPLKTSRIMSQSPLIAAARICARRGG